MGRKSKLKALRKEMGISRDSKVRYREWTPQFYPDWMKYSLDPFGSLFGSPRYLAGFDIGQVTTDDQRHNYQMAKRGI